MKSKTEDISLMLPDSIDKKDIFTSQDMGVAGLLTASISEFVLLCAFCES